MKLVTDATRILVARGLRAFGDGFIALLVPIYLVELGFTPFAVGAIVTSTLLGTALLTLWVGIVANRYSLRRLLLAALVLMAATGVGFALIGSFWPLLLIAFVGMAVVAPEERPAAASFAAVPKTFAWVAGSLISGWLLTQSPLGWPLLIGGAVKGVYAPIPESAPA